jgi:glucose/arabinose dehydrogenase
LKQTLVWVGRAILLFAILLAPSAGLGGDDSVRSGATAYGDWRDDALGVRRLISPADLSNPYATPSTSNSAQPSVRPASTFPKAPAGFAVDLFADGMSAPRVIRVAPNGDIFVADSGAGRVRVFRVNETNAKSVRSQVFAENLPQVFGIAFYPSGDNPHWIYVATEGSVARFRYQEGVGPGPTHCAELANGRLALDARSGVLA